ncbi:SmORF protein [Babesia bovis T2Bo]|uniref:SmORF n=1 Tax=Babesia bovis TaxID=5865 RepID=A7AML7_BABBO|nr:SmORF protein [Babesia bovis T2Bo]EDO07801.1 SmORF protein [Babesia bovis T2Bo]|eukprot:XP_001611369.1 SmORF [Babesia bovis]
MVAFNTFSKLCVVVAFGLSATVTATDVAQEQPKKESFLSRFFGKKDEAATEPMDMQKQENIESQEHINTTGPSNLSVEWLLLPRRENRRALTYLLPDDLASKVPMRYIKPLDSELEERIREFFSLSAKEQLQKRLASYGFQQ